MRYSEPIDSTVLDSLFIEDLDIITGHIVGSELHLLTEKMEKKDYHFTLVARDRSMNRRFIKGKFRGSERVDTFPPAIVDAVPRPFSTDVFRYLRGRFVFSEELDTSISPHIFLIPDSVEIQKRWNKDLVRLEYNAEDTLLASEIYYLLIVGTIRDISNNSIDIIKAYPFTPDSILDLIEIKGRIEPPCTAIVVAKKEAVIAIGLNFPIPGYTLHLKDTADLTIEALRLNPPMFGSGTVGDSIITIEDYPEVDIKQFLR